MRRIALAAALAATLAGGAAALAATPGPATPASPDPYQGAWALAIDGTLAGPVTQVEGCGLAAPVVRDQTGGKRLAQPMPEECTFQAGAGMTADFTSLLTGSLNGAATTHQIEFIRTDPAGRYGLLLDHARLTSVGLPKIDRAGTAPVFLQIAVEGERITRDPAPRPFGRMLPATGFDPATLKVGLSGQPLGASAAGPWTATIKVPDEVGMAREATVPGTVDVGDLPLRIPEASAAMARVMDPWVHSALVDGAANAEQPVKLTLGTLVLTLDHAAPDRADLVPRADGARTYSLYAEHAAIAAG